MENQFTNCEAYDNLFPKYKNWEEVPMSTLNFYSKTSQVCFVSLPKDKALEIITSKAIPVNTIAYEYSDFCRFQRLRGDVRSRRMDRGILRQTDNNTAGACAQIQRIHARMDPFLGFFHKDFRILSWNQHMRVHSKRQTHKLLLPCNIL